MKRGQQKIKFGTNIPKPNAPGSLQITSGGEVGDELIIYSSKAPMESKSEATKNFNSHKNLFFSFLISK